MNIDNRAADTSLGQPLKHTVNQGRASHLDQGLWSIIRERTKAGSQTGGQDHGC
jgi:hypothetical protein